MNVNWIQLETKLDTALRYSPSDTNLLDRWIKSIQIHVMISLITEPTFDVQFPTSLKLKCVLIYTQEFSSVNLDQ